MESPNEVAAPSAAAPAQPDPPRPRADPPCLFLCNFRSIAATQGTIQAMLESCGCSGGIQHIHVPSAQPYGQNKGFLTRTWFCVSKPVVS